MNPIRFCSLFTRKFLQNRTDLCRRVSVEISSSNAPICNADVSVDNPSTIKDSVLNDVVRNLEQKGHSLILNKDYAEKSIIPVLLNYNVDPADIVSLICHNIDFLNVTGRQLAPILKSFVACGIRPDAALMVLAQEPRLLKENDDVIFEALTALLQLIPNKASLSRFVEHHPSVLYEVPLDKLLQTKTDLGSFFSDNDIRLMMQIHPELLLVDFEHLEDIYEYMHYVMRLGPKDLVRTRWFSYPLEYVRLRHEFVVRTGLYVCPDPKRPAVAKYNPKLKKIIDTSDQVFSVQVCGVSLEEYEMFKLMYAEKLRLDDELGPEIRRRKSRSMQFSMDDDEWENYKLGERDAAVVGTDDNPGKMVRHWSCKPVRGETWKRKRK